MEVTLPEEFLLIAYSDDGTPVAAADSVDCGLAGAVLMELLLADRLTLQEGRVRAAGTEATGEPLLDDAWAQIQAARRPKRPRDWVRELRTGLRDRVLDQLVARGVLHRAEDRVLWVFPRVRYPSVTGDEPAVESEARRRLRAVLDGHARPDPRTAALCALLQATGLAKEVFGDLPGRERKRRLAAVVEQGWPDQAVRRAIQDLESEVAMMAAMVASTAAATAATTVVITT